MSMEQFHINIATHIAAAGQSVVSVPGARGGHGFSYTIGNTLRGLPELLLIGSFDPRQACIILNALGEHMRKAGKPFEDGTYPVADFPLPLRFRTAGDSVRDNYTVQAGQHLGRENYAVTQVILCDKHQRYPGDAGCDPIFDVPRP